MSAPRADDPERADVARVLTWALIAAANDTPPDLDDVADELSRINDRYDTSAGMPLTAYAFAGDAARSVENLVARIFSEEQS
jgi:hypothetical protein